MTEHIDAVEEAGGILYDKDGAIRWDIDGGELDDRVKLVRQVIEALIQSVGANPEEGIRVWWEKCGDCEGAGGFRRANMKDGIAPEVCPTCNGSRGTYRVGALVESGWLDKLGFIRDPKLTNERKGEPLFRTLPPKEPNPPETTP